MGYRATRWSLQQCVGSSLIGKGHFAEGCSPWTWKRGVNEELKARISGESSPFCTDFVRWLVYVCRTRSYSSVSFSWSVWNLCSGKSPVPGWRMAPWPFKNIMQTGIQNIVQNYGSICFLNCHPGRLFIFKFAVPQLAKYPSANLSLRISYHHVLLILNAAGRVIPFQGLRMGSCLTQKWTVQGDIHAWQSKRLYWEGSSWAESRRVREPRSTALIRGLQSQVLWRWDSFPGCLWPIILTQSLSWWHIHCSAEMDSSKKDSERLVGRVTSPFDLPEFFWLAVAY